MSIATLPKINPLFGIVVLGTCGISAHSYMQHMCTKKEKTALIDRMFSSDVYEPEELKRLNYLEHVDSELLSAYNIPLFLSSIIGGLFMPQAFVGLVYTNLGLRFALSSKKNKVDFSSSKLEDSVEYKALTACEFAMIGSVALLPLKFLLLKKF